jgi:hypothetical protein
VGNGCEMRCGTRGSDSITDKAGAVLGGGARPTAVVPALFSTGRKKKAGWAKRPSRPVGWLGRLGQKLKEILFEIKIRFLYLPRLWKFAQEDLGGILTQGFFLNSSRILKDFRKNTICHVINASLSPIKLRKSFS